MFEKFFQSHHFREIVSDYPSGAHDEAMSKGLFKRIVFALELFLSKAHMCVAWESPAGKAHEVESFVTYDSEQDRVNITPIDIGRCIVTVGSSDIFMPHPRAAVLLARKLVDLVSNMQNGAVTQ